MKMIENKQVFIAQMFMTNVITREEANILQTELSGMIVPKTWEEVILQVETIIKRTIAKI